MAVETANYISELVLTNPASSDDLSEGDDQLRLVKKVVQQSFPSISGAVTLTHTQINGLDTRLTTVEGAYFRKNGSDTMTGSINMGNNPIISLANPSANNDAANKLYVDNQITATKQWVRDLYPVGTVYINQGNGTNPATLLGFGSWTKIARGRVLIGEGSGTDVLGDTQSFADGSTGGRYYHPLTVAEMPSHSHTYEAQNSNTIAGVRSADGVDIGTVATNTGSTGGSGAHNNIQPYLVVNIWKRTA